MANDRIDPSLLEGTGLPKPEVEIIIDGESIRKPGMKTYFVEVDESGEPVKEVHTGVTAIETVCTCNLVTVCDCVANTICTCDMVCSCDSDCGCDSDCSCESVGGTYCTCNPHCTCVPVH